MQLLQNTQARTFGSLGVLGLAGIVLGGCSTAPTQAVIDQALPVHLELAMTSAQPTFGVGDELGWLAFGDLALAPLPGEPRDVLVVAQREPVSEESFDWIGRYLALAD